MNHAEALRVLGVTAEASRAEALGAFALLRTHLEARAWGAEEPGQRAACVAQIEELSRALGIETEATAGGRRPSGRAVVVAAGVTTLAVGLAWWGSARQAAEPSPGPALSAAEDAVEPSLTGRLSVHANLPGATAEVEAIPEMGATAEVEAIPRLGSEVDPTSVGEPNGIRVPADGSPVELDVGVYRLRVAHPDCPDVFTSEVEIRPSDPVDEAASVCRDTSWLVVRSDQFRDRLFIDGVSVGATGPVRHTLSPGEHEIRVEKSGFADWQAKVGVPAAGERTLQARLERLASGAPEDPIGKLTTAPGGSHSWHAAVSQSLLRRYDHDLSGYIDTNDEVESISCQEWRGLERSYETGGLAVPMSRLYGFDGSRWVKDALGFDLRVRDDSYQRMRHCGLD